MGLVCSDVRCVLEGVLGRAQGHTNVTLLEE